MHGRIRLLLSRWLSAVKRCILLLLQRLRRKNKSCGACQRGCSPASAVAPAAKDGDKMALFDPASTLSLSKSVRGYSHVRKELVCEDSALSLFDEQNGLRVAVVADGHGDPACMRSGVGAELAVQAVGQCAVQLAGQLRSGELGPRDFTDAVLACWRNAVQQHLESQPLTPEELAQAGQYAESYQSGQLLTHVYGSTLIAALMLPERIILLQQGDGRCCVLYGDGAMDQPIPWDDRCFENLTTSLCDTDAAESFRSAVLLPEDRPVAACWLGTDGVEDAYTDMEGTYCFYRRLTADLLHKGEESFLEQLDEYLPQFSRDGSGDDVSVAALVNAQACESLLDVMRDAVEKYALLEPLRRYREKLVSMSRKHEYLRRRLEESESRLLGAPAAETVEDRDDLDSCRADYEKRLSEFNDYDTLYRQLKDRCAEIEEKLGLLHQEEQSI